jgi:hypothetical protein|tara:strand:+ start:1155 stop:1628 length:474 start_codon:yes stop_codon:yes gene_type:complete
MNKYIHKNIREKFAKIKRESVKDYYTSGERRKWIFFTSNHTSVVHPIDEDGYQSPPPEHTDTSDLRAYYDSDFPTRKNIESEIRGALFHIKNDIENGIPAYGFTILMDAAVYCYESHREKLEGVDPEPTGEHTDAIATATLTKEDVLKELESLTGTY